MDIKKIIALDNLIASGQARTPKGMAHKLNVSERTVYNILNFMKEELNAPIKYDKNRLRYYYANKGKLHIKWWNDE